MSAGVATGEAARTAVPVGDPGRRRRLAFRRRVLILAGVALVIALYLAFNLQRFLSLEALKAQQASIAAVVQQHPLAAAGVYFAAYVLVTGLSIPGAAVLTLAGGAFFGLLCGSLLVSFASSVGATLAFLAARFLFRDAVRARFGERLRAVDAGVAREGAFYLLALRLVPVVPFFLVNLAMGVTALPAWAFYWVSQLGMLPATIVYVNAGTQLARISSLRDVLSPGLIASFTLLAALPLAAKGLLRTARTRRFTRRWPRPRRFDRNLVVIGGGSAGLVAAYIAAAVKASVTLVEEGRMGGDCLNTGCVPSKALIRSATLLAEIRRSREFGIRSASADFDFAEVMERVQRVIRTVAPHDSVERYTSLGVECLQGRARITSPYTVEIRAADGERTLATRAIVIAAGARPFVPPIPGIDQVGYFTSDDIWQLRELPPRLVVLGGGPVGTELAQCFARFGSRVTQVEMLPRILAREDPEISAMVATRLEKDGVSVLAGHKAVRFAVEQGDKVLVAQHDGKELKIVFDALLCAVGRVPNTAGYGLEELGIGTAKGGTIETDGFLQTIFPTIYACGDVAGPYQFTHTGAHQAWYASVNALFGRLWRFRADYSVIPWATFTDPEVARVGLNETEAAARNIPYEVTRFDIGELDRAITDEEAYGVVKVLTVPGRDRILGATIVAAHAGELIAEWVIAMKARIGLNKILGTIHVYPTMAEANKYAAGAWKRGHVSGGLLRVLEHYHAWQLR